MSLTFEIPLQCVPDRPCLLLTSRLDPCEGKTPENSRAVSLCPQLWGREDPGISTAAAGKSLLQTSAGRGSSRAPMCPSFPPRLSLLVSPNLLAHSSSCLETH